MKELYGDYHTVGREGGGERRGKEEKGGKGKRRQKEEERGRGKKGEGGERWEG